MSDPKLANEVLRCLEAAGDRAALKGAKAEDILQGMLSIYVATRIGLNRATESQVLAEVSARIHEFQESVARGLEMEMGPPLGDGEN